MGANGRLGWDLQRARGAAEAQDATRGPSQHRRSGTVGLRRGPRVVARKNPGTWARFGWGLEFLRTLGGTSEILLLRRRVQPLNLRPCAWGLLSRFVACNACVLFPRVHKVRIRQQCVRLRFDALAFHFSLGFVCFLSCWAFCCFPCSDAFATFPFSVCPPVAPLLDIPFFFLSSWLRIVGSSPSAKGPATDFACRAARHVAECGGAIQFSKAVTRRKY